MHTGKNYDGYALTNMGYDYLVLNVFMKRNIVKKVGLKIGMGKESDIYLCTTDDPERPTVIINCKFLALHEQNRLPQRIRIHESLIRPWLPNPRANRLQQARNLHVSGRSLPHDSGIFDSSPPKGLLGDDRFGCEIGLVWASPWGF